MNPLSFKTSRHPVPLHDAGDYHCAHSHDDSDLSELAMTLRLVLSNFHGRIPSFIKGKERVYAGRSDADTKHSGHFKEAQ